MSRSLADRVLTFFLGASAVASAGIVVLIVAFVALESLPSLREPGVRRFFTDKAWRPTAPEVPAFAVTPILAGSLLVTAGAMLIAGPVGILSALFTRFYAPKGLAALYRRVVELLNGVPSVVFGLWGLVALVPLINRIEPPGQSLLAGMLVLSLMILPTIALTAEAALRAVPRDDLRAAAALGLGRWSTVWGVALPSARAGIVAGMLLAAARAVGETMAVVMVCGNLVQIPTSVFDPVRTVTANIALEMGYATAEHRASLFVTGLMLMLLIAGVLVLVELVHGRRARG